MIPLHPVSSHSKSKAWYNQSAEETLARLGLSAAGLTAEEAARCLATDGSNELKEGKRMEYRLVHEHQSGLCCGHFFWSPDIEPTQRDTKQFSEDNSYAVRQ
jgi:hypothetical protein